MAVIYLRHPTHGAKVASLDLEAQHDEQHGWERYTPSQEAEPEPPVNQMPRRLRRKEPDHVNFGG